MSYRIHEHEHKQPIAHTEILTTPNIITITNGEYADYCAECFYVIPEHTDKLVRKLDWPREQVIDVWTKCYYYDIENRQCWASTGRPWNCHMCHGCNNFIHFKDLHPIHLRQEYDWVDAQHAPQSDLEVHVSFEKNEDGTFKLPGLSVLDTGIETYPNDNLIRVRFKAECESAQTKSQSTNFSLTISSEHNIMKQVVNAGKIKILPAIL